MGTAWVPVIDISRHQGRVDFRRMRARGVAGVIIRATHGHVVDDRLVSYVAAAREAGYGDDQLGFYAFCNPKRTSGFDGGRLLVEAVRRVLGHTRTVLMLDIEDYQHEPGGVRPVLRGPDFAVWLREHIRAVRLLAHDAALIAYSNAGFWDPWVGDAGLAADLEWIVPRYPVYPNRRTMEDPVLLRRWIESSPKPPDPHEWADWIMRIAPTGPRPPSGASWAGWQFSAGFNRQGEAYGCQSSDLDLNIIRSEAWERWTSSAGSHQPLDPAPSPLSSLSSGPAVPPGPSTPVAEPPAVAGRRDLLLANAMLAPGQAVASADGGTVLVHQTDGNVVLYHGSSGPRWASNTFHRITTALVMQDDGNLVLRNGIDAVWSTATHGNPGAFAIVHDRGVVEVMSSGLRSLWSSELVGQVAPQPSPPPPPRTTRVLAGDGWWRIATRCLGDGARWEELAELNGGPGRVLHPGDELLLP